MSKYQNQGLMRTIRHFIDDRRRPSPNFGYSDMNILKKAAQTQINTLKDVILVEPLLKMDWKLTYEQRILNDTVHLIDHELYSYIFFTWFIIPCFVLLILYSMFNNIMALLLGSTLGLIVCLDNWLVTDERNEALSKMMVSSILMCFERLKNLNGAKQQESCFFSALPDLSEE